MFIVSIILRKYATSVINFDIFYIGIDWNVMMRSIVRNRLDQIQIAGRGLYLLKGIRKEF